MKILFLLNWNMGGHLHEVDCLTDYSGSQQFFRGLVEGCLRRGWHFEALRHDQRHAIKLKEALVKCPADAVVLSQPTVDDREGRFRRQWARAHPLVMMAPPKEKSGPIGYAYVDEQSAVNRLAMHLLAEGHGRIDFVGRPIRSEAMERRYAALQAIADREGLPPPRYLALPYLPDLHVPFLEERSGVEAVLCFNDLLARDLMHRLARKGLTVPDHLAVCGMDGIPQSAKGPTLTSAVFDWGLVAEQALCRIEEKREGRMKIAPLLIPPLRIGASSLKRSRHLSERQGAFLRSAEEILAEHFRSRDCASRAAAACGVSRPHFLRQYQRLRRESFTLRILDKRLAFLAQAILQGKGPIHPMAQAVGFKNHIYFYRAFKKRYGMTPLEWRRRV